MIMEFLCGSSIQVQAQSACGRGPGCPGVGATILIAFLMMARLLHERAHWRKTGLPSILDSKPATKHCSALSGSAVSRKKRNFKPDISSVKHFSKEPPVV